MANVSLLVTPSQPSLKGSKLPIGHVMLSSKYHGTPMNRAITGNKLSFCIYSNNCMYIYTMYLLYL